MINKSPNKYGSFNANKMSLGKANLYRKINNSNQLTLEIFKLINGRLRSSVDLSVFWNVRAPIVKSQYNRLLEKELGL